MTHLDAEHVKNDIDFLDEECDVIMYAVLCLDEQHADRYRSGSSCTISKLYASLLSLLVVVVVLFGCAVPLAYYVRLLALDDFGLVLHQSAPWFNYHAAKYLDENGWSAFLSWHDNKSWYPYGRPVARTIHPGLQITAVGAKRIIDHVVLPVGEMINRVVFSSSTVLPSPVSLKDVCCLLPCWAACAATILIYFLTKSSTGGSRIAGLVAACVMAAMPAHTMFTTGGLFDEESLAIATLTLTLLAWTRTLNAVEHEFRPADVDDTTGRRCQHNLSDEKEVPGSLSTADDRHCLRDNLSTTTSASSTALVIKAAQQGALPGVAYGYMASTSSNGYLFVSNIIAVHTAIIFFLVRWRADLIDNRQRCCKALCISFTSFYITGTFLTLCVPANADLYSSSSDKAATENVIAAFTEHVPAVLVCCSMLVCTLSDRGDPRPSPPFFGTMRRFLYLLVAALSILVLYAHLSGADGGQFLHFLANRFHTALLERPLAAMDQVNYDALRENMRTIGFFGWIAGAALLSLRLLMVLIHNMLNHLVLSSRRRSAAHFARHRECDEKEVDADTLPDREFYAASFLLVYTMAVVIYAERGLLLILAVPIACALTGYAAATLTRLCLIKDGVPTDFLLPCIFSPFFINTDRCRRCMEALYQRTHVMRIGLLGLFCVPRAWVLWNDFVADGYEFGRVYAVPVVVFKNYNEQTQRWDIIDDYLNAYMFLKQRTPKDSRVLAWWDYGSHITGIAERTSLIDEKSPADDIASIAYMLTSPPQHAHRLMRHVADYVLLWCGDDGDIPKSDHMARDAQRVYGDLCQDGDGDSRSGDDDDSGNRRVGWCDWEEWSRPTEDSQTGELLESEVMRRSFVWHAYYHGEQHDVTLDTSLFELAYESQHGLVKIFKVLDVPDKNSGKLDLMAEEDHAAIRHLSKLKPLRHLLFKKSA